MSWRRFLRCAAAGGLLASMILVAGCQEESAALPAQSEAPAEETPAEVQPAAANEPQPAPERESRWRDSLPDLAADPSPLRSRRQDRALWFNRPRFVSDLGLAEDQLARMALEAERMAEQLAPIERELERVREQARLALAEGDLSGLQVGLERTADLERSRQGLENELLVRSLSHLDEAQLQQLLAEPRRARRLLGDRGR